VGFAFRIFGSGSLYSGSGFGGLQDQVIDHAMVTMVMQGLSMLYPLLGLSTGKGVVTSL
jgi:hypothetical protein